LRLLRGINGQNGAVSSPFNTQADSPLAQALRLASRTCDFPLREVNACHSVLANMILTTRQQEVLDYIEESQTQTGMIPTTREIQKHFGFASQTAAVNHLRALEKKGLIQKSEGRARAAVLTSRLEREAIFDIPIYGQIPAGMAETAEPEVDGMVSIDAASSGLRKKKGVFALKVRGDSMIGAGINDGDLVILEKLEPRNGSIVAALIDGETTLKRYVVSHGRPYLKAENPRFPDLRPVQELVVQGVMSVLIRRCQN
jgi:repressor LexA